MQRHIARAVLALVAAGGLLFGLLRLGEYARDRLHRQDHYAVAFAALRCEVPPGLTPGDFLAEVQYLGGLPDQLDVLEPRLAARLAAAFALHPWVERVEGVALRGPDGPRVRLRLRTPALAAAGRVLDAHGVLLPAGASAAGLMELRGAVPPPAGPAGAPWGNADVEGAARTAALLRPFQDTLRLTDAAITSEGLEFRGRVRVRWGQPGGAEAKLARLRELCAKPDGPRSDVDLRHVE
jgi:hypothetical protein